jgi:ABC-type antimicrobial peptide transport system permease subunit
MDEQIADNISNDRLVAMLAVSFGVLATVLAAIGLYGVLAYVTAQRTREIGIRMALGAQRFAVMRLVLTDVLWLAGSAIVVTLPLAVMLSRTVRSQLYNVSPADPMVLIVGTLMIAAVALLSALLPARRAATVEPMRAEYPSQAQLAWRLLLPRDNCEQFTGREPECHVPLLTYTPNRAL